MEYKLFFVWKKLFNKNIKKINSNNNFVKFIIKKLMLLFKNK